MRDAEIRRTGLGKQGARIVFHDETREEESRRGGRRKSAVRCRQWFCGTTESAGVNNPDGYGKAINKNNRLKCAKPIGCHHIPIVNAEIQV